MLRETALSYLADRSVRAGETVQCGWFIFRVVSGADDFALETLDFREMASFTQDFSAVERIHVAQQAMLSMQGVEAVDCTLQHSALVSRCYVPGRRDTFIERFRPVGGTDSGWYIGILDDPSSMEDRASFAHQSLYELSIHDSRLLPYWLLPHGYRVFFDGRTPNMERVEPDGAANRALPRR